MNETETARPDESNVAPGRLLGAARLAQNLSVADVARQLKLTVHQVEALEAGEYERLPGPVFVRGFIRNYARFVKLDPEQLVHSAVKHLPHLEPHPPAPPSHDIPFPAVAPRRWPKYAAAIIIAAVAALAAYEFYFSDPPAADTRAVAPVPAPVQADPAPEPSAAPGQVPVIPDPSSEGPPGPPAAGAAAGERDGAPAAHRSALQSEDALPGPGEREVRMVFDQESWVEIRDRNGTAIFKQLNRRGTEKRVNGRPPLSVIVGNAHGVRFMYDDKPVDLARHTKIDVARFHLE